MQEKKLTITNSAVAFFMGFILSQLAVAVVVVFAYLVCSFAKIDVSEVQAFFNTALGYLICMLTTDVVLFFVFLFYKKKSNEHFAKKPSLKKSLIYIAIAILAFFALYPIIECFDSLLYSLGVDLNTLSYTLSTPNYFISLISVVILPAICEELLFRGIVFKGLKKHGKIFSIMLTALLFMLFHLSISQTIYPFLFGLVLGVIMYREDNIIYCILAHLTNNFLALTLSYFNINLVFNHWTYLLLALVLLAIFIGIILYFTIKNHSKSEKLKPNKTEIFILIGSILIMAVFWVVNSFYS